MVVSSRQKIQKGKKQLPSFLGAGVLKLACNLDAEEIPGTEEKPMLSTCWRSSIMALNANQWLFSTMKMPSSRPRERERLILGVLGLGITRRSLWSHGTANPFTRQSILACYLCPQTIQPGKVLLLSVWLNSSRFRSTLAFNPASTLASFSQHGHGSQLHVNQLQWYSK